MFEIDKPVIPSVPEVQINKDGKEDLTKSEVIKIEEEIKEKEKPAYKVYHTSKKYSFSKNSILGKYIVSMNNTGFLWLLRKFTWCRHNFS